jgi:hypothetical protein
MNDWKAVGTNRAFERSGGAVGGAMIVAAAALSIGCASADGQDTIVNTNDTTTYLQHESDAESLVTYLDVSLQNTYASSPSTITWSGNTSSARTVCATFLTLLLEHSYGWTDSTFTTWMGTTSPTAATYHDAIVKQNGFLNIPHVTNIAVGDVFAAKYYDSKTITGHIMIFASTPRLRTATAPLENGTTQYEIDVIDSSSSYHGSTDTRVLANGATMTGVGKGIMRLYANADGTIAGHTWSTSSSSTYYTQSVRNVVIGRLNR